MTNILSLFKSRYNSVLFNAFPEKNNKNAFKLIKKFENPHYKKYNVIRKYSKLEKYSLQSEDVLLPRRFYLEDISDSVFEDLDLEEKQIMCSIFLLNQNGYNREKYLKKLLSLNIEEWTLPFLLSISADYVKEILQTFYNNFDIKQQEKFKCFCMRNKNQVHKCYNRMISYWDVFYRMDTVPPCIIDGRQGVKAYLQDYIGYKLFREYFEFSPRRKEMN